MNTTDAPVAPKLQISRWLNTEKDIQLEDLKGQVVALFAFQMLCPGCVAYTLPQFKKVHTLFAHHNVAVIGLHTVFEHHDAMQEASLTAFLHEYKIDFPVGIDQPSEQPTNPLPKTMRSYDMNGTPTIILLDKQGRIRKQKMGHEEDLILGAEIMMLLNE